MGIMAGRVFVHVVVEADHSLHLAARPALQPNFVTLENSVMGNG